MDVYTYTHTKYATYTIHLYTLEYGYTCIHSHTAYIPYVHTYTYTIHTHKSNTHVRK